MEGIGDTSPSHPQISVTPKSFRYWNHPWCLFAFKVAPVDLTFCDELYSHPFAIPAKDKQLADHADYAD